MMFFNPFIQTVWSREEDHFLVEACLEDIQTNKARIDSPRPLVRKNNLSIKELGGLIVAVARMIFDGWQGRHARCARAPKCNRFRRPLISHQSLADSLFRAPPLVG